MMIDKEMHVWKTKWLSVEAQERPKSLQDCLKVYSKTTLPNIFCLLKLFSTLPVSLCSCKRSASTLRRLNNYPRCAQSEERLTLLALIHCNYTKEIGVDEICQLFLSNHPRKMQSASILFDWFTINWHLQQFIHKLFVLYSTHLDLYFIVLPLFWSESGPAQPDHVRGVITSKHIPTLNAYH